MRSLMILCALTMLAGCYNSSTISTSETNLVKYEECRELLKPGHPNEQFRINRDFHFYCLNYAKKNKFLFPLDM